MPEPITPAEMVRMGLESVGEMERAQTKLDEAGLEESELERRYLRIRSELFTHAQTMEFKTAKEREAWVDAQSADTKADLTYAKNRVKANIESVRNARQKLSWLQTVSNQLRDDMGLAKYGPELYPSES